MSRDRSASSSEDDVAIPRVKERLAFIAGFNANISRVREAQSYLQWFDGFPDKVRAKEWFIAETTFGDRVVLKALPEEYTYDFKTADETFIMKDKIKRWMQFPDSLFIPVENRITALETQNKELVEALDLAVSQLEFLPTMFPEMNDCNEPILAMIKPKLKASES